MSIQTTQDPVFHFAEESGDEETFPFEWHGLEQWTRSLETEKQAFDEINGHRHLYRMEALRWSPYMNGKALEISSMLIREGKFLLETNEPMCYATSFIVLTSRAESVKDEAMSKGLTEALTRMPNQWLKEVYFRLSVGICGLETRKLDGGVAVFAGQDVIVVTTVVGRTV